MPSRRSYTRPCVVCGTEYTSSRRDALYCSPACANRRYRLRAKENPTASEDRACQGCGEVLASRRHDARFCSKNCASRSWYYEHRQLADKAGRLCPCCGKELGEGRHANALYCDSSCREIVRRVAAHGLTFDEYKALLASQNGACAICGCTDEGLWQGRAIRRDGWHIDHDHNTGKVRGVLCPPCNLILGYAADDPSRLRAAAIYLEPKP